MPLGAHVIAPRGPRDTAFHFWVSAEGDENTNLKRYQYPLAALFTIAKTWMQPKCPLTEEDIIYHGSY